MNKEKTLFEELYMTDISGGVKQLKKKYKDKRTGQEKQFGLSYLAWAYAYKEMKRIDPEAKEYPTMFELQLQNGQVIKVPYLWTPQGYFVEHTVIVKGHEEKEILPVLDNSNNPIKDPNAFQINNSNKRCFVKALAKHGLGLHIYVGEDFPDDIAPSSASESTPAQGFVPDESLMNVGYDSFMHDLGQWFNKFVELSPEINIPNIESWVLKRMNVNSYEQLKISQYGEVLATLRELYKVKENEIKSQQQANINPGGNWYE